MSERDLAIPKEYRRTVSRAEIFTERLNQYRRAFPAGPINTWAEAVEGQRSRVKSLRVIERLSRQLTGFRDSAPDLSDSLFSLQHAVVRLTHADDDVGFGEERWDYNSKISQFRKVKHYEEDRSGGFSGFEGLLRESDRLPVNNRLFINTEDRQIVFRDRLVAIEADRDWEVFLHIVRNRSKGILPREIEKIARDNGATDSQASANSIRRLRRLLEADPIRPEIITTNKPGRSGASYSFGLKDVRFYRPSQEVIADSIVSGSKKNPVDIEDFKQRTVSRRRLEIGRRDPEVHGRVKGIIQEVNSAPEMVSGNSITLFQVSHAFPTVKNEFMAEMQSKYINPEKRERDKHPGFKKHEVVFMVYFRRFGERLNLDSVLAKELFHMIRDEVERNDQTKSG